VDLRARKRIIIRDNYQKVLERIHITCRKAGRNPDKIRLVVVTKTHPVDVIRMIIEAGATDFGENYIEEAVPKIQDLIMNKELSWHMIGHVQSRKAQTVGEYFQYLHSLDSVKLAEKLSRFALVQGKPLHVWMEFNVSGEGSKYGWNISSEEYWKNILPDIGNILALPNLDILGVMTIPPYSDNSEYSRLYYKLLKEFQEYVIDHFQLAGFRELSMGMSSDFEVAIQEGSTCVRVGQAVLGPRPN
jgi:pyridoxal phosphate enzyme (YggS family)